jgi:SagB-type dehydrogenase family enzyme
MQPCLPWWRDHYFAEQKTMKHREARARDQGRRIAGIQLSDRSGHSRRQLLAWAWRLAVPAGIVAPAMTMARMAMGAPAQATIKLPTPRLDGDMALETALLQRRSVRKFGARPLSLAHAAQLLWAGQGVTSDRGGRTAPSAGATYPLEVHLAAGAVSALPAGLYRFQPQTNELKPEAEGDLRAALVAAAHGQAWIADAPAVVVITGVERRTAARYGRRAKRYVQLEAGHVAQNIALQAVALGLASTPVGAFDDDRLHRVLGVPAAERPLYLLPVGHPA